MAPPSNVEATAFILDISPSSDKPLENGNTFLSEAINCMKRVVEKKIFSRPDDLLLLALMGSAESNNRMYKKGDKAFQNISIATELSKPTWDLIELLNKLKISNCVGDWIDALIVTADHLTFRLEEMGTKTSCKKIILMSDFKSKTTIEQDQLQQVINGFNSQNIDFIFIGSSILKDDDDEEDNSENLVLTDDQEFNLNILSNIIEELDANKCTFDEANHQLKFHKKKTVNLRPWNVDLSIGNDIKIPISGYGRIRNEPPVKISWNKETTPRSISNQEAGDKNNENKLIAVETKRVYSRADDNMETVNMDNVVNGYIYGDKTIPFTKLESSMNYQSGERGLICFGFTKGENVNCSHLSDNGITFVTGRKDNKNSCLAVEALATMLKQNDFVLIARKVYNKGNAPRMVALFPIIKKTYKCLSMITLAYKEDHRHLLLPGLNQTKYKPDEEQLNAVDDLIKAMDLSQLDDNGKPVFSIDANINPTLQYTYDSLAYRATHPGKHLPGPRPEVQNLLQVPNNIAKLAVEPLEKIKELFPLVVIEKISRKKEWIDKHQSSKDDKEQTTSQIFNSNNVTATAVLVNKVTKIGTINPTEDFKEISKTDFINACEQMKIVIEGLVIFSSSDDFNKPISALKEMRLSCQQQNPAMYNDWLITFKDVLLNGFKGNFLKELFDKNLGLITVEENNASTITKTFAKIFEDFALPESISKQILLDDMSDLFD